MFCGCCKRDEPVALVIAAAGSEPMAQGATAYPGGEINDPFAPTPDITGEIEKERKQKEEKETKETKACELASQASCEDELGRAWHSFSVTIERPHPGEALGVVFDACMPSHIYVTKVSKRADGTMPMGLKALHQGDFITSVNGTTGEAMARELQCALPGAKIDLAVRRPIEYEISILKGQCLGCGIIYDANVGCTLGISGVQEGPVMLWNERAKAEGRRLEVVQEGDRIVAVNGQHTTSLELLEIIRNTAQLKLTMSRPCSEDL